MKKILTVLFLLSMNFQSVYAQISSLEQFQKTYSEYFQLNREYVHLHLSKTKLIPNEDIWFSAYVYDLRTNLPNSLTTNLNLAIFNNNGEQIQYKTFYINNGFGKGYLNLENLPSGRYLIKASTNYMNNFKEDLAFSQTFEIFNNEINSSKIEKEFDLQVLPEGGHILANTKNHIGIKLINNLGEGEYFSKGVLLDDNNKTITTFKSNHLGISHFTFTPNTNKKYHVSLNTSTGKVIKQALPKIEENGVNVIINNYHPDNLFIAFQTNKKSISDIKEKPFYFIIHQNGKFQTFEENFSINNSIKNIVLKKKDLFKGVNTLTVLNERFEPILERMFYNTNGIKRLSSNPKIVKNYGDSIQIEIKNKFEKEQNLSISVYPSKTESYSPKNNILSSFLLKPYIKSPVENANYYFKRNNEVKKLYDLDLLLITQGWSKYDWKNIFSKRPDSIIYKSEKGFRISGKINKKKFEKSKIVLTSNQTNLFEILEPDKDKNFSLNEVYLIEDSKIHIGQLKSEKLVYVPTYLTILPNKKNVQLSDYHKISLNKNFSLFSDVIISDFTDKTNILDTVVLKNKLKAPNALSTHENTTKINEQLSRQFMYIYMLIETRGYQAVTTGYGLKLYSKRGMNNFSSRPKPLVILDNVPINDLSLIRFLKTSDVESIEINKIGSEYGIRGVNGVIKINTKGEIGPDKKFKDLFSMKIKHGFTEDKEYYTPKYKSYSSDAFTKLGHIFWNPKINIKENESYKFKIPNTLTDKIVLYIEGMSTDGYLISEEIELEP